MELDIKSFLFNLRSTKPPYSCPVPDCGKSYKTFAGIHQHIYQYDHSNPEANAQSAKKPGRSGRKGRGGASMKRQPGDKSPSPPPFFRSPKETLTYAESQRLVEIDHEGKIHRLNIYEPLDVISQDEIDNQTNSEKEEMTDRSPSRNKDKIVIVKPKKEAPVNVKLPEAQFNILEDYAKPPTKPEKPSSYRRYIEKTAEQLDDEVEYDMDEEDFVWLEIQNKERAESKLNPVTCEEFEKLMNRFEKEAHFQSQSTGSEVGIPIDEDAVCSICMDGECQNTNVILFCDMCNLAVHQECYGVPYIPEGLWHCRRCLHSPSRAVECCLCPNSGGAFKQTDDSRWAHVVCALWIPEVGFANTVFLEPIDCLGNIPPARWKLSCYICKQRGTGACIQCHKTNCYTAFHVTCAQQAGLYMKIEPVRETGVNGATISVRKSAFCDVHGPADGNFTPMIDNGVDSDDSSNRPMTPNEAKAKSRQKMRKARKILADKRAAPPVVSLPHLPQAQIRKISSLVSISKKTQFMGALHSYWLLKRQSRNGVPLLRRLQMAHAQSSKPGDQTERQSGELRMRLQYWQRLRQDLERVRLLVELIRKREKLKHEGIKMHKVFTEMRLQPLTLLLRDVMTSLQKFDQGDVFKEPVSSEDVPDYFDVIKNPMDFSTMWAKVDGHHYTSVEDLEADFNLMLENCLTYNSKDSSFYKLAVRMRDAGGAILRRARRQTERDGFDKCTGLLTDEPPLLPDDQPVVIQDVDTFLPRELRDGMPLEDQLKLLLDKFDEASNVRPRRSKITKRIKTEVVKVRRQLALQKGLPVVSEPETESQSQADTESAEDSTAMRSRSASPLATATSGATESAILEDISSPLKQENRSPSPAASSPKQTPRSGGKKPRGRPPKVKDVSKELKIEVPDEPPAVDPPPFPAQSAKPRKSQKGKESRVRGRPTVNKNSKKEAHSPMAVDVSPLRSGDDVASPRSPKSPASAMSSPRSPLRTQMRQNAAPESESFSGLNFQTYRSTQLTQGPSDYETHSDGSENEADFTDDESEFESDDVSGSDQTLNATDSSVNAMTSAHTSRLRNTTWTRGGVTCESPELFDETSRSSLIGRHEHCFSTNHELSLACPNKTYHAPEVFINMAIDDVIAFGLETQSGGETDTTYTSSLSPLPKRQKTSRSRRSLAERLKSISDALDFSDRQNTSQYFYCDGEVRRRTRGHASEDEVVRLEALDLVWAKCRGYPWYPALIINPKMPKTGYFHNGVPIPVPPSDVLDLGSARADEPLFLVLFFDTKRTWQWLPRNKLEPLGVDSGLDKAKLADSKKQNVKNAVKKAYEKAVLHRCKVTGESNPLPESDMESEPDDEL